MVKDQELLDLIKEEFYRIKPSGCWDFFRNRDRRIPCLQVLRKRFSMTYNQILITAGISEDELSFVRRTPEQYLQILRDIANKLGYAPSANEFRNLGYTPEILAKYYGTYNNAIEKVGFTPNERIMSTKVREDKKELSELYIDYSNSKGKPASYNELMDDDSIYNANVFCIRFGGMSELKKLAGFYVNTTAKSRYSKQEIKDILVELYKAKGDRLTVNELRENNMLPSYGTILKYFKTTSISDIWVEVEQDMVQENRIA